MRSNAWRFEPSMPSHHSHNESIMCRFGGSRHREISSDRARAGTCRKDSPVTSQPLR